MIKLENADVFGWESAIRGMRNPMNSWDKSDSYRVAYSQERDEDNAFILGPNDLALMKSLSKAGNDHAKYLRMINVSLDLTAPLYFWKQFDQYKVGVTTNSCSTMHKIHSKEFTIDDFSHEHLKDFDGYDALARFETSLLFTIDSLNIARKIYLQTGDKQYWWQMIQLLPSSYNQKRTVQLNYQVLKSMYKARWNHKLDEWVYFCEWMHDLPYFKEICLGD